MIEFDTGCDDDPPTLDAQPQAKIDIVVADRKALIESADRFKRIEPDEKTRSSRCRDVPLPDPCRSLKSIVIGCEPVPVLCRAHQANDDSVVLNAAVRIEKAGTERADAAVFHDGDQAVEPANVDDIDVIVEEAHELATGAASGSVCDHRKIERIDRMGQDLDPRIAFEAL